LRSALSGIASPDPAFWHTSTYWRKNEIAMWLQMPTWKGEQASLMMPGVLPYRTLPPNHNAWMTAVDRSAVADPAGRFSDGLLDNLASPGLPLRPPFRRLHAAKTGPLSGEITCAQGAMLADALIRSPIDLCPETLRNQGASKLAHSKGFASNYRISAIPLSFATAN
jgi:hypothetical protein